MRIHQIKSWLLTGAVLTCTAVVLPGCFNSPRDGGSDNGLSSAQFASDEVSNMGIDAGSLMDGGGLAKEASAMTDTTYINRTIHPYVWDTVVQAFTRSATFSTSNGFERTRLDTVTFQDAAGVSLRRPTLATVSTIHHVRHVTHQRGGLEANVVFNVAFVLNKGATDTTLVKNGTMTGTYGDEQFASGKATDVTRHRVNGRWQFPQSGTLEASFPRYTYSVVYTGSGGARVTVNNLIKDKVTVTTIQVDQR